MTSSVVLSLATRVRPSAEVLFQKLQDEAVLLDLKSGMYFGLDAMGARIWQLLTEQELLSDVALAILAEYEVSEDRCTADLLRLVAELKREGLVTTT